VTLLVLTRSVRLRMSLRLPPSKSHPLRMELPCVMLWRPQALDCRALIPPEAWSWLTHNPPAWDPNLGPPASEIGSLTAELSVQPAEPSSGLGAPAGCRCRGRPTRGPLPRGRRGARHSARRSQPGWAVSMFFFRRSRGRSHGSWAPEGKLAARQWQH